MTGDRYRAAVIARAAQSPRAFVMPACWRERRALRRMAAYGAARPAVGLPDVWVVTYDTNRESACKPAHTNRQ